jgi:hypothetical protein
VCRPVKPGAASPWLEAAPGGRCLWGLQQWQQRMWWMPRWGGVTQRRPLYSYKCQQHIACMAGSIPVCSAVLAGQAEWSLVELHV